MRAYYIAQGSLLNALLGPKWEGNPKKKEYMYTYGASQVVLVVKNPLVSARDTGDMGSIPGSGRSAGGGNGNPLQYDCGEISWTE